MFRGLAAVGLCLTIVLLFCQHITAYHRHLYEGNRHRHEFLLKQKHIKKDWDLVKRIVVDKYTYHTHDDIEITYIEILDLYTNGHGGNAEILSGGVGWDFVAIKFKSKSFRGFEFIVNIYGIKKKKKEHPDVDILEF